MCRHWGRRQVGWGGIRTELVDFGSDRPLAVGDSLVEGRAARDIACSELGCILELRGLLR